MLTSEESKSLGEDGAAVKNAWHEMLGFRGLRCHDEPYWSKYEHKVSTKRALGHDFSANLLKKRSNYINKNAKHY
jgi:hypothetical protein